MYKDLSRKISILENQHEDDLNLGKNDLSQAKKKIDTLWKLTGLDEKP